MTKQFGEQYELKRKLSNDSAGDLKKILEAMKSYKPSKADVEEPPTTTATTSSGGLESRIITSDDYWTIQNVNYQGKIQSMDLSKELLPRREFNDLMEYVKKAKVEDFIAISMRDTYSLFKAVYESKDKSKEEIRSFLKGSMENNWLKITTVIQHRLSGKDQIIHDYSLPNQEIINQRFVGPDELVKDSNDFELYNHLLGSKNVNEINEIFNWITGKDLRIYRFNFIKDDFFRVGCLHLSDYSGLFFNNLIHHNIPSLGVRLHKAGNKISFRKDVDDENWKSF